MSRLLISIRHSDPSTLRPSPVLGPSYHHHLVTLPYKGFSPLPEVLHSISPLHSLQSFLQSPPFLSYLKVTILTCQRSTKPVVLIAFCLGSDFSPLFYCTIVSHSSTEPKLRILPVYPRHQRISTPHIRSLSAIECDRSFHTSIFAGELLVAFFMYICTAWLAGKQFQPYSAFFKLRHTRNHTSKHSKQNLIRDKLPSEPSTRQRPLYHVR